MIKNDSFFFESCVPGNSDFHKLNTTNQPLLYGVLEFENEKV